MPILGVIASSKLTAVVGDYDSIATVSVGGGGAATVEFTSIPATYTHLQLRYIAQKTSNGSMYIRFNGDSGSNYTNHSLQGNGTTASVDANTGANGTDIGASDSSGNFAASVIDILDYTSTNKYTTIRQLFGRDYNGSGVVWLKSGLWLNTAAITSITLVPDSTNVVQYSHFALYGIKAA
jgi:hypothetical protein